MVLFLVTLLVFLNSKNSFFGMELLLKGLASREKNRRTSTVEHGSDFEYLLTRPDSPREILETPRPEPRDGSPSLKTPGITPEITPGITPGIAPGIAPGITPGTTPGITPGITPEI